MQFAFMSIAHKWCQNHTVNTLHYHILCVCVFVLVFLLGFVYPWAMLRSTEIELKTAFVVKVFTWESKRGFCESHLIWYFAPAMSHWPLGEELTADAGWSACRHSLIFLMLVWHWGYIVKCSYAKYVWSLARTMLPSVSMSKWKKKKSSM